MKKISLSFIVMLVVIYTLICPVYAANHTFSLIVSPLEKTAKLGDTVTFDISIANIDQSTDGILAVEGMVNFESDLIESVDINTSNNWSVTINENDGDPLKGKFAIVSLGAVKETQLIARLHATIRSDATVKTGKITLKDVFSSYSDGPTEKTTKIITVNIDSDEGGEQGQDDEQIIISNDPEKKDEAKPVTPSFSSKDKKTSPQIQAKDTTTITTNADNNTANNIANNTTNNTTSKAKALPKAGIVVSGIGIAVLAAIIVAIIELIKYKRTGK